MSIIVSESAYRYDRKRGPRFNNIGSDFSIFCIRYAIDPDLNRNIFTPDTVRVLPVVDVELTIAAADMVGVGAAGGAGMVNDMEPECSPILEFSTVDQVMSYVPAAQSVGISICQ